MAQPLMVVAVVALIAVVGYRVEQTSMARNLPLGNVLRKDGFNPSGEVEVEGIPGTTQPPTVHCSAHAWVFAEESTGQGAGDRLLLRPVGTSRPEDPLCVKVKHVLVLSCLQTFRTSRARWQW